MLIICYIYTALAHAVILYFLTNHHSDAGYKLYSFTICSPYFE